MDAPAIAGCLVSDDRTLMNQSVPTVRAAH